MNAVAAFPPDITRVVFVVPRFPEISGGSRVVANYADMFTARGLRVDIVSLYAGDRSNVYTPEVIIRRPALHRRSVFRGPGGHQRRWHLLPLVAVKRVDRWWAMRRFHRFMAGLDEQTMVVFTHVMPLRVLLRSGFTWPARRPILLGQHHSPFSDVPNEPGLREDLAEFFSTLDGFTALSEADAQEFATLIDAPCSGLPNPLGVLDARQAASTQALTVRPPVAVTLSRLEDEKQVDLMIRAFARATATAQRHWTLQIYGSGSQEEHLRAVIAQTGMGERVTLMGPTDRVDEVLSEAAINLLSSRHEGFGMTVLEAAAWGVPSLAFASSPGIKELGPRVAAVLVEPPLDEESFATALHDLLADPAALRERGTRARLGARQYTPEALLPEWGRIASAALRYRETRATAP